MVVGMTLPVGCVPELVPVVGVAGGVKGIPDLSFLHHCPLGLRVAVLFFGGARWVVQVAPASEWDPIEGGVGSLPEKVYTSGNQGHLFRSWVGDAPVQVYPAVRRPDGHGALQPGLWVPGLATVLGAALHVLVDLDAPALTLNPQGTVARSLVVHIGAALITLARRLFTTPASEVSGRLLLLDLDKTGVLRPPQPSEMGVPYVALRRSRHVPLPRLEFGAVLRANKWSEGLVYHKNTRELEPLVWTMPGYGDAVTRLSPGGASVVAPSPLAARWMQSRPSLFSTRGDCRYASDTAVAAVQAAARENLVLEVEPHPRRQAVSGTGSEGVWEDAMGRWFRGLGAKTRRYKVPASAHRSGSG